MRPAASLLSLTLVLGGCQAPPPEGSRGPLAEAGREAARDPRASRPPGTEIVVAGRRFDIGTPVVLWFEAPRYDAYATGPRFAEEGKQGLRYQPGRTARSEDLAAAVEHEGWSLEHLRQQVDQLVLHYDVCGSSRTCFKVLQDLRQLSVHFLLDVDGTLYQTLDLKEQAWHASQANPRSVGVEIAHIGAYPIGEPSPLDEWYPKDADGHRLQLPERLGDGGVRTPGFQGRPARAGRIQGRLQGGRLEQYDYTPEQYDALAHLSAGLSRALPGIRLEAPRDAAGRVRSSVLSAPELERFQGILGHYHISKRKVDPGPALDWEKLLGRARQLLANP